VGRNSSCYSSNLADYKLDSNEALQKAQINDFVDVQIQAMDVEMNHLLSFRGKWATPWPFFSIKLLNIIEKCIKEVEDETSTLVINNVQINKSN